MKILHVLNSNKYSGAENVVCQIINMTQNQSDLEMSYCSPDGQIREVLLKRGIHFIPLSKLTPKTLNSAILEYQPDIIHAHDFTASVLSAFVARNIPVISHLHNNPPWIKQWNIKTLIYGMTGFKYKKILTVSNAIMNEYVAGQLFKKKSETIGNPVNLDEILSKVVNIPQSKNNYDVAFLGRLTPQKNPLKFVDIIYRVKKTLPNIQAIIIGDGELKEEVSVYIETLKLRNNIKLLGYQSNPYIQLNAAHVLCMPSDWEGFGLAAIEALALGKPVIASPVGGLVDIVDYECGALCNDVDQFAYEIISLLSNKKELQIKSLNATKKAQSFHNIGCYCERLKEIYFNYLKV